MSPIVHEHFRVPREDRRTFIRPAPADQPALLDRNRRLLASCDFALAGRPFGEFRAAARAEIVGLARRWTERPGTSAPEWSEPMAIVLSGHQPAPFHPGVWIKNFLAGSLARAAGGVALNLDVDSDEAHAQVFRMPTRDLVCHMGGDEVRMTEIEFAPHAGGVPLEEQPASALDSEAVHRVLDAAPSPGVAEAFRRAWRLLAEAVADAATLGEAFVRARRRLEAEQGLENLELPVSVLADSAAFRLFLAEMLRRRDDFYAAYNDSLHEYRRAYHEENAAQPLPDLARDGERMEMPYWVWRAGERRRRLWVEPAPRPCSGPALSLSNGPAPGGGLVLSCDSLEVGRLDAACLADPQATARCLARLRQEGWKIRPRALSMTLFARLAVGDVFIHGLGGALYDKITDALIERLFGVRPPELILASCTVHLPLETYPSTPADLEAAIRAVRDWRYNPDRVMSETVRGRADVQALIEEKRRLVAARPETHSARFRSWRRVRQVNARLAACWPDGPQAARRRLERVRRELDYNAVLSGREYPFFLYPAEDLAAFYREATWIDAPRI